MDPPAVFARDSFTPATPAIDLGPHEDAILGLYYALLVLGGCVGLPLTVATMFFAKTTTRRHPTLINLLLLYFVYAMVCLILLYAGQEKATPPDFALCLAQASLNYGSAVGATAATLSLVLQLWMDLRGIRSAKSHWTVIMLVAVPWILFLLVSMGCIIYATKNPTVVTFKWLFYCSLDSNVVVWIVRGCTLFLTSLIVVFQGSVLFKLFKASRSFRAVNRSSCSLCTRVTIFAVYSVLALLVFLISVPKPQLLFSYIFISSLPLSVFLVFGTQMENLRIWFRVRPKPDNHGALGPIKFGSVPEVAVRITTTSSAWSDVGDRGQEKAPKHDRTPPFVGAEDGRDSPFSTLTSTSSADDLDHIC